MTPQGELQPVGHFIELSSGSTKPPDTVSSYGEEHPVPVFGGNGVTGYSAQANHDGDLIVIGRVGAYCGNVRYHNGPAWITDNALFVSKWKGSLQPRYMAFLLQALRLDRLRSASGQPLVSQAPILAARGWFPELTLQRRIAASLAKVDEAGALIENLCSAKMQFKLGLMQQLFSGERRFPMFIGRNWTSTHFGGICREVSQRNSCQLGADSVMGVIKGVGFQPMRDRVRGKGGLARYKVVPPAAFAFNPMRLNIGSIAYNNLGRAVLVSPDYVVFQTRPELACAEYINQLRFSNLWANFMERAGAGSVRVRIYFDDLARMQVPAPAMDEQLCIAAIFDTLDREIELLKVQRQQFEHYKRGILSRLLSGEIAVPA